ncbi:hypothetical protein CLIB1444_01S11892 [[Candida] jaroonii]|uniref:Uncharacterized protein n=1 Tax=[Candida] jaroonii TaxID=467808 RepID=A0ACA9Y152_9ASCO|nr:hypothetical protein CLIB1444_01S11892 [[Candida] jaroonii]
MFRRCYSVTPVSRALVVEQLEGINKISQIPWKLLQSQENGKLETKLKAEYKLKNFPITWEFLNTIALAAHKSRHHPEITTVYNNVTIELTTHDLSNNVSQLDLDLASTISEVYTKCSDNSRKVKFSDFLTLP